MTTGNFQADFVDFSVDGMDEMSKSVEITSYGDGSCYSVELTNCETNGDVGMLFALFSAYVHKRGYDCDVLVALVRAACGKEVD